MNIFDLLESPGMGRPRDSKGVQSAADQSAASVIGSGTTKREAKKKPVHMMGSNVKESVEEAAVKPNFKMPPESLQDKMYRQHQELRKKRGAPSAEEYKQRIAQKQAEIDALKEGILDRAIPKMPKPRNPADQVLRGKVNAAGKHLDKKRRQELNPKHKHQDPLEEGWKDAVAGAALAGSIALGGMAHAGEPVMGQGQSQNMQMAVDMAKHNAKLKYMKTVHGDNFQDKQMPDYRFGKVELKPNDKGGYIATVPLIVDSEVQESLRPGERHHFEINPATGKREYKGIRGDRTDAPQRAKDDPAARADQERRAHIQHDRGLTEQDIEEEFRLGKKLGTRRDRFKSLRKRKDGILGEVEQSQTVKITDYDLWLDKVKELGAEIHPQKDRNVLVAQSWDGEEIGKFHLGKEYGFINQPGMTEDQLDEACWKGYHKEGMKTMFGKRYPNCVKNKNESLETYVNLEECPGCGGHMVAEDQITEKQDACYHKVKSRYKVWPSAYASGALVQCRKKGAANWGNKSNESITQEEYDQLDENLKQWFSDKWVRFGPDGKIRGDCARGDDSEGKPKCLPQSKAHALGKKGRASAAARKRKQDPNPERSGKAINVNTKKKSNEGVDEGIKGKLAAAALAGATALGGGAADAQNIDLPGPQSVMIAHIYAEVNGREINRTVNLGTQYQSEEQAEQDLEEYMQSKGITRYTISIEQKYDQSGGYRQGRSGSGYATGPTATGPVYAPGLGDMIANRIGQELRAGIPSKGGYATGGTNRGQRERDGSQWWRDRLPQIMKEEPLEEDIERHLLQMRRAGYDIVQEEWSDKYKSSINCSNPKGFSQKAHCAGRKKNKSK
jgi:hypothetical protein